MQTSTLWWIAAGALTIGEMLSGTFYLLVLAGGAAAGALAAHAGADLAVQLGLAAVVAAVGVAVCRSWYRRRAGTAPAAPVGLATEAAEADPDIHPDIGQHVHVAAWSPEGTARVRYRGADWAVRWAGLGAAVPGALVIAAVHGAELQLVPPPA
ncbi:NfeD family protein [Pseudaquabacterium rugosum]|uniref:NfeD family protein n=1 Tax=Pseudaquabacterium rugosum TaxID=2984194 RepID=A0ABU9B7J3_9BURK